MNVLITGVPGWLGGRFLEVLARGFDDKGPAVRDWRIRCLVLPGEDASFIDNINRQDAQRISEFIGNCFQATYHLLILKVL